MDQYDDIKANPDKYTTKTQLDEEVEAPVEIQ
jgi:hypothetical protein